MREPLYEVCQCGMTGSTYELTLHGTEHPPVMIHTDDPEVVMDLVMEHVHYYYKKSVHEKIKALMPEPSYIGYIDSYSTPHGKAEIRSSKMSFDNGMTNYEVLVDGTRRFSSAYYHVALGRYVKEVYSLIFTIISAQITHLITWLGGSEE